MHIIEQQYQYVTLTSVKFARSTRPQKGYATLANEWLAGDRSAEEKLVDVLAERGLDLETIMAQALADKMAFVERIKWLLTNAAARPSPARC